MSCISPSIKAFFFDAHRAETVVDKPAPSMGCCARISGLFKQFNNSWVYRLYDRNRSLFWGAYSGITYAFSITAKSYLEAPSTMASLSLFQKTVRYAKILAVVSVPFALYYIGYEIKEIIGGYDRPAAVLRLFENLSWLSDSVARFTAGLHLLGVAILNAAQWVFSFYIASAFLSLATIILNARSLAYSFKFKKELKTMSWTQFQGTDNRDLGRYLNISELSIKILKKSAHEKIEKNENIQGALFRSLLGRIKLKCFSNEMEIFRAMITFVGMMILLFSPWTGLAYGIMAIAALITIGQFFYDRYKLREFEKQIKGIMDART